MSTHEERWGIFVDFAATVHSLLEDARTEMATAILLEPITPGIVDQLYQLWAKLTLAFGTFNRSSASILKSNHLTPEERLMATSLIEGINEAARQTDDSLRLFFQRTGLANSFPSRSQAGEGLRTHGEDSEVQ